MTSLEEMGWYEPTPLGWEVAPSDWGVRLLRHESGAAVQLHVGHDRWHYWTVGSVYSSTAATRDLAMVLATGGWVH